MYGGCYQGLIDELDQRTGLTRDIMPWPAMNLTERTDSTRYRFNWTAPILVSQHDANVIDHGGITYSEQVMNNFLKEAMDILDTFPESPSKTSLRALVDYSVAREK